MICPACHTALEAEGDGWRCVGCGRAYPSHHGIPDLRLAPDPYLGVEQDRARADAVVAALDQRDFPSLLDYYWSLSDETPPPLRRRFIASARRSRVRARHLVRRLAADGLLSSGTRVLEIGSGTAPFLVEAARLVADIVGLDIALRWLHVGRRRLLDDGCPVPSLVCAGAEALPFPEGRFDLVVCVATLEFMADPGRALAEAARVLRPGGSFFVNTVNRFSLATEPHVGLWGVGFLPRAWQDRYVRARGRGGFGNLRLLARADLHRLGKDYFQRRRIEPAEIPGDFAQDMSAARRLGLRAYGRLRTVPPARALLQRLGPEWDAVLTRD